MKPCLFVQRFVSRNDAESKEKHGAPTEATNCSNTAQMKSQLKKKEQTKRWCEAAEKYKMSLDRMQLLSEGVQYIGLAELLAIVVR